MGGRDFRHRETKKTKKEAKKLAPPLTIINPPVEVEIIKKKGRRNARRKRYSFSPGDCAGSGAGGILPCLYLPGSERAGTGWLCVQS